MRWPSREGRSGRCARAAFWVAVAVPLALFIHGLIHWKSGRSSRDRWGAPALASACVWLAAVPIICGVATIFGRRAAPSVTARCGEKLRQRSPQFLLGFTSLALSLAAAELAARRWLPSPPLDGLHDYSNAIFDQNDWQESFCEIDVDLGWRGRANASGWITRPDVRFCVEQNSAGFRDIRDPRVAAGDRRIVVLGDSFVWGFGVEQDETLTARMRTMLADVEVHNLGVCGYGTDQSLLNLRRFARELRPTRVFYCSYVNDLSDNQRAFQHGHSKPRFTWHNGELALHQPIRPEPADARANADSPPTPLALLAQPGVSFRRAADYYVSPRSTLYRHVRRALSEPAAPASGAASGVAFDRLTTSLVEQMQHECEQAGAGFTLVLIPERSVMKSSDPSRYFDSVRSWSASVGIDCLDLTSSLARAESPAYLIEGHWSAAGHAAAAAAIARHLLAGSRGEFLAESRD